MKNPFKKIIHSEELPESVRRKVLEDIEIVKLSLDLADLFAIKYPNSLEEILKLIDKPNNN
ncbi:hypothetical protein [Aquimarina sp. 2201CG5-10]|uniref:hypothetical protein n=1 Tax=Aquimarina callyspongiae TaxID=3098150 RepID=UPI002AB5752B|nr:hypothetical protein [Aquimarina sp. 2201CG5-10]MDY8134927.1 hypothetical protein [Aquimarina sp. 2201CG5-10]